MQDQIVHYQIGRFARLYATRFSSHQARDYWSYLSVEEQSLVNQKAIPKVRDEAILSLGLRRKILADYHKKKPSALMFTTTENKKPVLVNGIHFNVSHSHDFWVIALAENGPVGIDVEDTHRCVDVLALAKRFFAAEEHASIVNAAEPQTLFWRYWTAKEALLKATGKGIVDGLDKVIIGIDEAQNSFIQAPRRLAEQFHLLKEDIFPMSSLTIAITKE